MDKIVSAFCLLLTFFNSNAATNITTSSVSGHWTVANSPYLIYNNIQVDTCATLKIDPGVNIVFQGYYSFTVYGNLSAVGNDTQPINFHVNDTSGFTNQLDSNGAWAGLFWSESTCIGTDTTAFIHCNIYDIKSLNAVTIYSTNFSLYYCNFFHNIGSVSYIVPYLATKSYCEMSHCSVYESSNFTRDSSVGFDIINVVCDTGYESLFYIHDCHIYNNFSTNNICEFADGTVWFENNILDSNLMNDSFAFAALRIENCNALIKGNKIHHNISNEDAAISCSYANATIENNMICNNDILLGFTGTATYSSMCLHVQGGGAIRLDDEAQQNTKYIIRNNILANNHTASSGGAIFIIGANADIVNNDIINNVADYTGGGISIYDDPTAKKNTVKVKNNLFLNNVCHVDGNSDTSDLFIASIDSIEFDYNWITKPYTKTLSIYSTTSYNLIGDTLKNQIGFSPYIIAPTLYPDVTENALYANFQLLSTSSCIRNGSILNSDIDSVDYAGYPRVVSGKVDIGAYQSEYATSIQTISSENILSIYPNPTSNSLYISTPEKKGTIELRDMAGKKIITTKIESAITVLDVHTFPKGNYFVVCYDGGNEEITQKVVLQ